MPSFGYRSIKILWFVLLLLTAFIFPRDHSTPTGQTLYEQLYEELVHIQADPRQVAHITNVVLQRDVATFTMKEGDIYLLTPVAGRIIGALFLGEGHVTATPPTSIEQEQLYRFYETRQLNASFKTLLLFFADSTLEQLQQKIEFSAGEVPGEAADQIDFALKFFRNKKGKYFDTDLMKTLLDNQQNGLFYAYFADKKSHPLLFSISPYRREEVQLLRRASYGQFSHEFETVCQFHQQADYRSRKKMLYENKNLLLVSHYQIESTIKKNLNFSAVTELEFALKKPEQKWIYFHLFGDMIVDSIFWDTGEKAVYFKQKHNPVLWVKLDTTLERYHFRRLKLFYHGDLLDRNEFGWIYIKTPIYWYPRYGNRDNATFDLTFHYPKDFTLISVGKRVFNKREGETKTTRWITPAPIRLASFNMGYFESFQIEDERIPPVTVYMAEGGHQELKEYLGMRGYLSGKDMKKQVGADIANSLSFFKYLFGDCPVDSFYATETPYAHGLAFPGLIHLAWSTFQQTDASGADETFRGHEVAHQWWGIAVDFKTYHDQWLSEGFSTYAGLWYMQAVLQDNKKFFKMLDKYRKEILGNRKYLFGSGQEAGPIWLGYRTQSSETSGDYDLIIYKKGAWVLHMLRNMFLDLRTMKEDRFIKILHDFYNQYRGKKVSTEDFQKIIEKHLGGSMDWFFQQWVYGTDIPTYRFAYRVEKTPEGKYLVHCRIKQEDVPENFKAYVIIKMDLGKGRLARVRVLVDKPVNDIALPLLPDKPKKVVFNDLESVLAKVKKEKWKD